MRRKTAFWSISIVLLASPFLASADTLSDLQAQVAALLAQIQSLQQQLASLQTSGSQNGAPAAPAPGSDKCVLLTHDFGADDTDATAGGDVTRLQLFFTHAYSDYSSQYVTGYFGPVTESALKQWQSEHGVVSSGLPDTTGWGFVGPRTRAALAKGCGGASGTNTSANTSASVRSASISASTGGAAGLTATITATVNTKGSCAAQTYALDYGDGSPKEALPVAAGSCQSLSHTFTHTYAAAGTYNTAIVSGTLNVSLPLTLQTVTQSPPASSSSGAQSCTPVSFALPQLPVLTIGNVFSAGVLSYTDTAAAHVTVNASGTPPGTVLTDQTYPGDTATSTKHQWSLSGRPTTLGTFPMLVKAENSCGGTQSVVQVIVTDKNQISCPIYQTSLCPSGQTLSFRGNDANGCSLGYQCIAPSISVAPSCTLSASPTSLSPTIGTTTLAWASTNATSAKWIPDPSGKDSILPSDTPSTGGSVAFAPPPATIGHSYAPTQFLQVAGPGGSAICSVQLNVNSAEAALFDETVFGQSTTTPTISGTATGVSQVGIVLSGSNGDKVYGSGLIPVTAGHWSVRVTPALPAGAYFIYVYDVNNNELTNGAYLTVPGAGSLTVSTDASTPQYQVVAGGSSGVTIGAFQFHATGEAVNLQKIGLQLTQGKPGDINQVYLYNPTGTLLGTAIFAGSNTKTVSTLSTGMNVPSDGNATLVIQADIAGIGTSQPGTAGDLITIFPDPASSTGAGVQSGQTITATSPGYKDENGVRIFRSYPTVALIPLPNDGLADGRLLRFKVTANSAGSVGIAKFAFGLQGNVAAASGVQLYAYTDSFSNPVGGQQEGGRLGNANRISDSGVLVMPVNPLEIPAGTTYYFELRGTVSGNTGSITTQLLADDAVAPVAPFNTTGAYQFVWSPNDYTMSQFSDADWTNGYQLPGLGASGISQTRTGSGTASASTPNANLANALTALEGALKTLIGFLGKQQ